MSICIREARISDSKFIWVLNCQEMGYVYPLEDTTERINSILSSENDRIFVAVCDNTVVGYVHICSYDLIFSPPLKNIMGIAVCQQYKRRGIGRSLLEKAEQWAIQEKAAGIRIISGATRSEAHEFYRKCGYSGDKLQINLRKIF